MTSDRPHASDQRTALYWWYAAHRTALYSSSSSSSVGKFVRQSGATDFRGISEAYQRHTRIYDGESKTMKSSESAHARGRFLQAYRRRHRHRPPPPHPMICIYKIGKLATVGFIANAPNLTCSLTFCVWCVEDVCPPPPPPPPRRRRRRLWASL